MTAIEKNLPKNLNKFLSGDIFNQAVDIKFFYNVHDQADNSK